MSDYVDPIIGGEDRVNVVETPEEDPRDTTNDETDDPEPFDFGENQILSNDLNTAGIIDVSDGDAFGDWESVKLDLELLVELITVADRLSNGTVDVHVADGKPLVIVPENEPKEIAYAVAPRRTCGDE